MASPILFTTPVLGYPASGGPMLRIENSIKALARISTLHIMSQVPAAELGQRAEQHYRSLAPHFSYVPHPHSGDATERARNADAIISYCRRHQISVVWLGYGNISYPLIDALKRSAPDLKLVCDTDSVWSRFVLRELPFCHDTARQRSIEQEARAKMAEERSGAALADVTTAVSEIDAEYYRSISSDPSRVQLFSNVIDLESYRFTPPRAPSLTHNPYLYLAGSFYSNTAPMTEAAKWLLERVWPIVQQAIPEAHCVILGKGADRELANISLPGVSVYGYVDSVLPYLCHAAAAVVPLHFESGTRFKILEAAACRIPVVSTILGAEGIPVRHGRDILIADEPASFAHHCIDLLRNPALGSTLANACYSLVAQQNSIDALVNQGSTILRFLNDRNSTLRPLERQVETSSDTWEEMTKVCGLQHALYSALVQISNGHADTNAILFVTSHRDALLQALTTFPSWMPDHLASCIEAVTAQFKGTR